MKNVFKKASVAATTAGAMLASASTALAQNVIQGPQVANPNNLNNPPVGFANNLGNILTGILSFVMVIAALLVLFYLILGGIEWITSGGDKGKTESARNKITAAVIGIIILAAAFAITQVIVRFLGFGSLDQAVRTGTNINGQGFSLF